MATLQVLMPMGGLGTRFRKVGITTPKPLIEVGGVPMFQRALASFAPWTGEKTVTVVVREDNDREFDLARQVVAAEPSADIVLLDHDTRGAVETCLEARDRLDPDQPLVIMDCDIAFDSPEPRGDSPSWAQFSTWLWAIVRHAISAQLPGATARGR